MNRDRVITIMGPTASGKTSLAIELAKRLGGEVISVDSALIYKGMDIGTAKPDRHEQQSIPHHLIDIIEPSDSYSVAQFKSDCDLKINEIMSRGNVPILAGGTMMYFNALINGLSHLPESQKTIRDALQSELQQIGPESMHQTLSNIDVGSAQRIHKNDSQRIIRALEVFRISGKSMTELQKASAPSLSYNFFQIAILPEDRAWLHKRIEDRFDLMLNSGFEKEVAKLMDRGDLHVDLPSMRSVGYRQMWYFLEQKWSWDEMRYRGIVATRQLAKRQITWLRGWDVNLALECLDSQKINKIIKKLGA